MEQQIADAAIAVNAWNTAITAALLLRVHAVVTVPADSAGWIDAGIDVRRGETVSLLATGTAHPAGVPQMQFAPSLFLCYRVRPHGQVAKLPASTTTFTADADGRLEFVAQFPGAWADRNGTLDAAWPRNAAAGRYTVAVLVWAGAADEGLALFAANDASGLGSIEFGRLASPLRLPEGWEPLWRTGATEVYREASSPALSPRILCHCCGGGGILKLPVDFSLDDSTRLDWRWRVTALPSEVAEDTMPTHDYLSIAVEFDNGLDLTYMWSAALPVGHVFKCPLPWWDQHETHQVVRSGSGDLGRWQAESQSILQDYASAIGGTPPARIVGVWLIAVAAFQSRCGECEYQDIRLSGGSGKLDIGSASAR